MSLGDFKLYGLCVERLKHQVRQAHQGGRMKDGRAVLESYCTADTEEIIDLLELYDLKDRSPEGLLRKLNELATDASMFVGERVEFGFNAEGELCINLVAQAAKPVSLQRREAGLSS